MTQSRVASMARWGGGRLSSTVRLTRPPTRLCWSSTLSASSQTPSLVGRTKPAVIDHVDSGHIKTGPDECLLYFDTVLPIKLLSWTLRLPWRSHRPIPPLFGWLDRSGWLRCDPAAVIGATGVDVDVRSVLMRLKEGGAIVKIGFDPTVQSATSVEAEIAASLRDKPVYPWWGWQRRMRANLVQGVPWIEDLQRFPSTRLRIELAPAQPGATITLSPALVQEHLYALFRPFGKLSAVSRPAKDGSSGIDHVVVDYVSLRRAIAARNCLHGLSVAQLGSLSLRIRYERRIKTRWIRDWIFSHPRVVIPIILALLTAALVAVFDPVRTLFIKLHIKQSLDIARWSRAQLAHLLPPAWIPTFFAVDRPGGGEIASGDGSDLRTHQDAIEKLHAWLADPAETFIVVQGPRGSGKRDLVVSDALLSQRRILSIDCKAVQEARGDVGSIRAFAREVGYWPVLAWANTASGLIDMAAQGATGVKPGLSETAESHLDRILNSATTALRDVALEKYHRTRSSDQTLTEDDYLEAHPDKLPVVVVDNFLYRSGRNTHLYDKLAEWTANLVTTRSAHVIFLTTGSVYSKPLSKSLPDTVFRHVSLDDLSHHEAVTFVRARVGRDVVPAKPRKRHSSKVYRPVPIQPVGTEQGDTAAEKPQPTSVWSSVYGWTIGLIVPASTKSSNRNQRRKKKRFESELEESVDRVGGRLTDLDFLVRRINGGERPLAAADQIIEQCATEIVKMYLLTTDDSTSRDREWNCLHAWAVISQLASSPSSRIHHADLMKLEPFQSRSSGLNALHALEEAGLVSISHVHGRAGVVSVGKPAFKAAFELLATDPILRSQIETTGLKQLISEEKAKVNAFEDELGLLTYRLPPKMFSHPDISDHAIWLRGKIAAGQTKISAAERQMRALATQELTKAREELSATSLS